MSEWNPVSLCADVSALNLKPADQDAYGETYLHGSASIGPYFFHVQAFEVEEQDGDQMLVDPTFEEEVDAVRTLLGGERPQTVNINGREYVLVIIPHAE